MNKLSTIAKQILEGADIRSSIIQGLETVEENQKVEEAAASAENLKAFYQSPYYKSLCKFGKDLLKKVENEHEYRIGDWSEDPLAAVHDEIDEFYYAVEHLKNIKLDGFPKDKTYEIQNLLTTAGRSYSRVLIKLKSTDTAEKVQKAFQPLLYSKKACTLLADYFEILGMDWDYDWKYSAPSVPSPRELGLTNDSSQKLRRYFDWIAGLYERYDIERAQNLISEKKSSLTDEGEIDLFSKAESYLR